MLQDYRELALSLKEKFNSIESWPEIEFNEEDISRLKKFEGVTSVNKHSLQLKIDNNHCVIPGQYILYSICIKELALAVKEYLDVFEEVKKGKSQSDIGSMLKNNKLDLSNVSIDDYSKTLALQIFINSDFNQGAKSIVNGSEGDYNLRGLSDFYTSIILKPINIPAASSSILGKFIYKLSENHELYNYLEHRFINELPYITKEKVIGRFVKNTISFLLQYDNLVRLNKIILKNSDANLTSIKDDDISLTSIFRTSSLLLDDNSLSMGDKIRYLKDPLFINSENEFVYLSTEWTDGKDRRLDLDSFKKIINKYYSEFKIIEENGFYFLKSNNSVEDTTRKPIIENILFDLKIFQENIKEAGLIFSPQLIQRFIASLCTKPFVICSGLSGSGKTKLAQAFAQWICYKEAEGEKNEQYCIVPVGADWTNREPLLGYPNALQATKYVKPENGVLELIVRAKQNIENNEEATKPYFLILDEMNLSHVERYFADFLSTMESCDAIPLHTIEKEENGIPTQLHLPKNLFIIGTVNIDETTYMFSPKVLDRANTIEFRLTESDLKTYIDSDIPLDMDLLKGAGESMGESFVNMATQKTDKNLKKAETDLLQFFKELKKAGAEFGYRTASEMGRLMFMLESLGEKDYNLLDIAIMQKLLPKLHGSRNKLTKVLPVLGGFCLKKNELIKENYLDKFVNNTITEEELNKDKNIKYPISFEKICRMYKNAVENGFASYAEA